MYPTLLLGLLCACGRESPAPAMPAPQPATPRPSPDLVDELAGDPARLKEVRRRCREDGADRNEALCIASALAVRQRFLGGPKKPAAPAPE